MSFSQESWALARDFDGDKMGAVITARLVFSTHLEMNDKLLCTVMCPSV